MSQEDRYEEDAHPREIVPGTVMDLTLPVFYMGECLLHAQRLEKALAGETAAITLRAGWERLAEWGFQHQDRAIRRL